MSYDELTKENSEDKIVSREVYLKLLSKKYATIAEASREIINYRWRICEGLQKRTY